MFQRLATFCTLESSESRSNLTHLYPSGLWEDIYYSRAGEGWAKLGEA
jgi:hypothetical protein